MSELPTTPGYYADRMGDPWKLESNGYWYDKGYVSGSSNRDMDYIRSRAPFTLLSPHDATVSAVLDRVYECLNPANGSNTLTDFMLVDSALNMIAKEFGL